MARDERLYVCPAGMLGNCPESEHCSHGKPHNFLAPTVLDFGCVTIAGRCQIPCVPIEEEPEDGE